MSESMVIDENTTFFRMGAVGFLDVMGFKGIWQRYTPPAIINKLRTLNEQFQAFRGPMVYSPGAGRSFTALTDTMVLSSTVSTNSSGEDDGYVEEWLVLGDLCAAVEQLWLQALADGGTHLPPLVLRGAIAWGEHLAMSPYIIGPAIDEGAENEKRPVGALVWFAPTAERLINQVFANESFANSGIPVVKTNIRLKGDDGVVGSRECWVVRPRLTADQVRGPLRHAFRLEHLRGDELSKITDKYEETMRFFETTRIPTRR